MATHDYVLANQSGSSFRTDLNNALAAVVSNNSNATEPATKYAYMPWADTNSGYYKIRNAANNAWIQLFKLDGTLSDIPVEGTVIKSTGESGGTKFLREDGDNSCSWQSISQTALTGSTNNTICTVTGANAIQGEADLTFDGTTFQTQHATGAIARIQNTTAATSQAASLELCPANGLVGNIVKSVSEEDFSTGANRTAYLSIEGRKDGTLAERLRIESGGNLKIVDGDLVIGSAGHGIDFSATSDASGKTSELLDDYEEGTWTPVVSQGIDGGASYQNQVGFYAKVGQLVHASFSFQLVASSTGSTGNGNNFRLGGLPFNSLNSSNYSSGGLITYTNISFNSSDQKRLWIGTNSSIMEMYHHNSSATSVSTSSNSGATIYGYVTYRSN